MSDLVTSPMFRIMLVLFGAIVTIGVIISLRGDLADILSGFCEQHPDFCGQPMDSETRVALASMDTLICAVNRVNKYDPNLACEIEGIGTTGSGGGSILLPNGGETAGSIILGSKVNDNPIASITGMASLGLQNTQQSPGWNPIECKPSGNIFEQTHYSTIEGWEEEKAKEACENECNKEAGEAYTCASSGVFPRTERYDFALPVTDGKVEMIRCDCFYDNGKTRFGLGNIYGTGKYFYGNTIYDVAVNCIDYNVRIKQEYMRTKQYETENQRERLSDLALRYEGNVIVEFRSLYMDDISVEGCEKTEISLYELGSSSSKYDVVDTIRRTADQYVCETDLSTETVSVNMYVLDGNEETPSTNAVCDPAAPENSIYFSDVGNVNFIEFDKVNENFPETEFALLDYKLSKNSLLMDPMHTSYYGDNRIITGFSCHSSLEAPTIKCTITGFHLPQSFDGLDKITDYIPAFGDPQFLVYFEKFPRGEEASWEGFNIWINDISEYMFAATCITSVVGVVVRLPGAVLSRVGGDIATKGLKGVNAAVKVAKAADKVDDVASWGDTILSAFSRTGKSTSKLAEGLKFAKMAKNKVLKVGGMTLASYVGSVFDSVTGKYTDIGKENQMVLQTPMESVRAKDVIPGINPETSHNTVATKRPILLQKDNGQTSPFYLAAPCQADVEVSLENVVCDYYQYDPARNTVTCTKPKIGLNEEQLADYPECGFDTRLAYDYGQGLYNSMLHMREHQELVEYTDSGVLDKIYLPHLSGLTGEKGNLYYKVNQVLSNTDICQLCGMSESERPLWIRNEIGSYDQLCVSRGGSGSICEWDNIETGSIEAINKHVAYYLDLYNADEKICSDVNVMVCTFDVAIGESSEDGKEYQFRILDSCGIINQFDTDSSNREDANNLIKPEGEQNPTDVATCWGFIDKNIAPYYEIWGNGYTPNEYESLEYLDDKLADVVANRKESYSLDDLKSLPKLTDTTIKSLTHDVMLTRSKFLWLDKYDTYSFEFRDTGVLNDEDVIEYDNNWDWVSFSVYGSWDPEKLKVFIGPECAPGQESGCGDAIAQTSCKIPAVIIEPDQDNYISSEQYNFCYTRTNPTLETVTTVVATALDVASLFIPGPIGGIIGIIANCGEWAMKSLVLKHDWPKGPDGTKG